ncbi:MAG: carboxypeptidase-like regulatory domain-containing protein [Calditrichaeota bacterium]|nr:carboxypeptidase-like regulatory domain-containing protein [Calditrichota bacterium]
MKIFIKLRFIILVELVIAFASCQNDKNTLSPVIPEGIHGYIVDERTNIPIENATISFGRLTFSSEKSGYFYIDSSHVDMVGQVLRLEISFFPYEKKIVKIDNNLSSSNPADTIRLQFPNKLREFQRLLLKAKEKKYKIVPVIDWYRNLEIYRNERTIIMRHDVDHAPITAMGMGFIEHQIGVHSTYYFRWATEGEMQISYLSNFGHEIGLHYETIATYCYTHNITKKEQVTEQVLDICRDILKSEIKLFESKYGDIYSICSHGDKLNASLGIPNYYLILNQSPTDFFIETWANSPEVLKVPEIFVADSGNKWDPFSFEEALDKDYKTIYVLMHPCWWQN